MLRKWKKLLAFILAMTLIATTFNSNLASIRVFADGDEAVASAPAEAPEPEPVQEEPAAEEYSEPEETVQETVQENPDEGTPDPGTPEEGSPDPGTPEEGSGEEITDPATEGAEEIVPEEEEEIPEEELTEEELAELERQQKEKEEAERKAKEPKLVTVTYRAELGGKVSNSSETINIKDEEARFTGSTASPVNKYYQFTAWVDASGATVTTDSTLVPSKVEEDTTYTAKFEKLSAMPAQNFSGSAGGLNVSVSAGEGIFPEGTTMHVSPISDGEAIVAAIDALGENVKQAKGVDISFTNADGDEIEPADSRYVSVSISLPESLEGDSFSVVHKDDSGNAEEIGAASSTGASFQTNSFSVYIIASVDGDDTLERKVATYIFEIFDVETREWKEVITQRIKSGEKLTNPGIPSLSENQVFKGWIDQETGTQVSFDPIGELDATKTVLVRANIETTYYVTLIGVDGEVVQVLSATAEDDGSAKVILNKKTTAPSAEQAFGGWKNKAGVIYEYGAEIDATDPDNKSLTAAMVNAYWIRFSGNDGSTGTASYTEPIYVTEETGYIASKPADPSRSGYTFTKWYKEPECVNEFNWSDPLSGNVTLYAGWTVGKASFTVIIWKQSIDDDKNATKKTYDYEESFVVSNYDAGTTIARNMLKPEGGTNATSRSYYGFKYADWTLTGDDNGKISPNGTTVVDVHYDRELVTLYFKISTGGRWPTWIDYTPCPSMSGLYGQRLADCGYTWPSEKEWHRDEIGGTHTTFLDAFIPPTNYQGFTITYYTEDDEEGSNEIVHIKQDLDGNYTIEANKTKSDNGGTFTFTNKYVGFDVSAYSFDKKNWTNTTAGTKVNYTRNLYIRYTRQTEEFSLFSAMEAIDPQTHAPVESTPKLVQPYTALYEQPLTEYEEQVRAKAGTVSAPAGYAPIKDNSGKIVLFADPAGTTPFNWSTTMPASNNLRVYVVFAKLQYTARYDLNVDGDKDYSTKTGYDTVTHPDNIPTEEELYYGATVSRDELLGFEREGYELVGWFNKADDNPYNYGNITGDVEVYAKWRKVGGVYIKYLENGGTLDDDCRDTKLYTSDSSVVVTSPPDPPEDMTFIGWELLDANGADVALYYPNSSFEILDEYIYTENGTNYVRLEARYTETGLDDDSLYTSFTYHPNGGGGSPYLVDQVGEGADAHRLHVNEAVAAWTKEEAESHGFVREGYELMGWNVSKDEADAGNVQVGFNGRYIVADNKDNPGNPKENILYAVWKPQIEVHVYISGTVETKTYTGSEQQTSGFAITSIEYKVGGQSYNPSNAFDPADVKLAPGASDVAKGTDVDEYPMGLTDNSFVSESTEFKKVFFHVTDGKLIISPAKVTITIVGNNHTDTYDGQPHTVTGYTATADVQAYDTGKISFSGDATATQTVVGTDNMGLAAAQFTNNDPNYTATFEVTDGYQTINPADITVTINGHKDSTAYDGVEHGVTGYDVVITGDLYTEDDFTFSGTAEAKGTDADTYPMGLAASQFRNTNPNFGTVTFDVNDGSMTITPIDVIVTITGHTGSATFDGQEHMVQGYDIAYSTPLYTRNDFKFTGTAVAKRTDEGTTEMGLDENQFVDQDNKNFGTVKFNVTDGYITIVKAGEVLVTITGHSRTTDYNGEEQEVTGYDVQISDPLYKESDFTFSGTARAARTDAGTTEMTMKESDFTNNSGNFTKVTFVVNNGSITINPIAATVSITGNNRTVDYNGEEQDVTDYTATTESTLYDVSKVHYKGDAVAARTDVGTTYMELDADEFENTDPNFTNVSFVIEKDGFITVDPLAVTVTVTGHTKEETYTGEEFEVTGYDMTADNTLYDTGSVTFSGDATAKGTLPDYYDMGLKDTQFGNSDDNFKVTFDVTDGYLKIKDRPDGEKFPVAVSTDSLEKEYTGENFSGFDYKVDGAESEKTIVINGVSFTVSGLSVPLEKRNVGTYTLSIEGDIKITDAQGHDVTKQFAAPTKSEGTLKINPMKVTFTSEDGEKVFDNKPLTVDRAAPNRSLGVGDMFDYDFTGSQTEVGDSPNYFTVVPVGETDLNNYDIDYVYGTLKVTAPTPTPPPGGDDPTPGGDDPTPGGVTPTVIPDNPTPLAAPDVIPVDTAAVLGATRSRGGAAVLGARRGRTDDPTNTVAKIFVILAAAAVAITLLLKGRKKEEEEN